MKAVIFILMDSVMDLLVIGPSRGTIVEKNCRCVVGKPLERAPTVANTTNVLVFVHHFERKLRFELFLLVCVAVFVRVRGKGVCKGEEHVWIQPLEMTIFFSNAVAAGQFVELFSLQSDAAASLMFKRCNLGGRHFTGQNTCKSQIASLD